VAAWIREQPPTACLTCHLTITGSYDDALRFLSDLKAAGIDVDDVTDQLERDGLAKFEASWAELTATVAAELGRNQPK
jgi:transaldolase